MFAAYPDFDVWVYFPALAYCCCDQLADTPNVECLERAFLKKSFFHVLVDDTDFHVISAEPERHLGKVIGAETDEVDVFC